MASLFHQTRRLLLAAAAVLLPASAMAQQPELSSGMANQMRYIEVAVISGRIVATSEMSGRSVTSSANTADRQEQLTVNLSTTRVDLHYELLTPRLQVSVDIADGDELTILRQPRSGSDVEPLKFHQPRDGQLLLQLGDEAQQPEAWKVDSLWHLLLAEPEVCEQELLPLLKLIKPDWRLMPMAEEVEEAMYSTAQASRNWNRQSWGKLVSELGSDRFAERRQAEQRLYDLGTIILPYLRGLDRSRLDAEQQYRVRMLVRNLSSANLHDTPQNVASWLVADPHVWYTLLERGDVQHQHIAADQLEELLGQTIQFDPAADPPARQAQLQAIKQQIARQHASE